MTVALERIGEHRHVILYRVIRGSERQRIVAYHTTRAQHLEEFGNVRQAKAWLHRYAKREEKRRI